MPIPKWPGLPRPKAPLPNRTDFDPWDGFLDALWAWENFGGLTLPQAWELFAQNPLHYQEAFMFMGPVAFAYYFPVIDRHLREAVPDDVDDDCLAWIIGCGVQAQLETDHRFEPEFLKELTALAEWMKGFVERLGLEDCETVTPIWATVTTKLQEKFS